MRTTALLSVFLIAILFSACHPTSDSPANQAKVDIPEPLDEPKGDVLSFKRGTSGNMVDALYFDLVKRTPDLQDLENQLEKFNAGKSDSLQAFSLYKGKVESYYASASQNLDNIKDTVLKARLKVLLAAGKNKYSQKADKFDVLIGDINSQDLVMKDYYETLKLVATLPVMEKY
jgi:hypothetical protein